MDKAIDFLRRELSDLERLMSALETAMERKQRTGQTSATPDREISVFGHDPAISLWHD